MIYSVFNFYCNHVDIIRPVSNSDTNLLPTPYKTHYLCLLVRGRSRTDHRVSLHQNGS